MSIRTIAARRIVSRFIGCRTSRRLFSIGNGQEASAARVRLTSSLSASPEPRR